MSEIETKRLCPKGSKVCPACKTFVKGPRTRVCACGHEFFEGKPAKVVKPKAVAVAVPVKGIDPYTFNVVAVGEQAPKKGLNFISRAMAIKPQPNNFATVTKYVNKMEKVVDPTIPSDVTFVF